MASNIYYIKHIPVFLFYCLFLCLFIYQLKLTAIHYGLCTKVSCKKKLYWHKTTIGYWFFFFFIEKKAHSCRSIGNIFAKSHTLQRVTLVKPKQIKYMRKIKSKPFVVNWLAMPMLIRNVELRLNCCWFVCSSSATVANVLLSNFTWTLSLFER